MREPVLAHERTHGVVGERRDRLCGMGDGEAVEADEDGKEHLRMLGEPWCDHGQVVCLLRVLGEELDRAGVPDQHGVRVVAVDVDRARQRAVPCASTIGAAATTAM